MIKLAWYLNKMGSDIGHANRFSYNHAYPKWINTLYPISREIKIVNLKKNSGRTTSQ
jgi:hypothetical protein